MNLLQAGQIDIAHLAGAGRRSARCSRTCAAATAWRCTRCGAARRRRSSWSRTATASRRSVVGRRIEEIDLPKGATIGAIVRRTSAAEGARRAGAAATSGDHRAPRHRDRARRPRDRVRGQQAHGAEGREAVPGRRRLPLSRAAAPPLSSSMLIPAAAPAHCASSSMLADAS